MKKISIATIFAITNFSNQSVRNGCRYGGGGSDEWVQIVVKTSGMLFFILGREVIGQNNKKKR